MWWWSGPQRRSNSEFVRDEADQGKRRRVLVPVFKEAVDPPLGFGQIHAADLSSWHPGDRSDAFATFLKDFARVLGPVPTKELMSPRQTTVETHNLSINKVFSSRAWLLALALVTTGLTASGVYSFLWRAEEPVRPPDTPTSIAGTKAAMGRDLLSGIQRSWRCPLLVERRSHPATQPRTFTDPFKDGSLCRSCPELVVVPAGTFTMGSSEAERDWAVDQGGEYGSVKDERPAHPVRNPNDFALGRSEVTRRQFARFVETTN